MPKAVIWKQVDGAELIDALDDQRLSELLPQAAGVYVWRRRLVAPSQCRAGKDAFCEWLENVSMQPLGRITRRPLSHCVWAEGLQVGGGGLTDDKRNTLQTIAISRSAREFVINFVESLSQFTALIYVGQTDNLRVRIRDHLNGDTALHPYVSELLGLEWADLELRFFTTQSSSALGIREKAFQELLELVAQRLLAPFATTRPG